MADTRVFPWAAKLDVDQLSAFIDDLWGAASGDGDLKTLDAIERVIAEHGPSRPAAPKCPLTPREIQVLTLYASGETKDSIGRTLGISGHTVRTLCLNIRARLNARNMANAVAIGAHYRWLSGFRYAVPHSAAKPQHARYAAHAARMRKQPGAQIPIGPYTSYGGASRAARRIREGQYASFRPAGTFTARAVREDDHWRILAAFLGGSAAPILITEGTQS